MKRRYLLGIVFLVGFFLLSACSVSEKRRTPVSETSHSEKYKESSVKKSKVQPNEEFYNELSRNVTSPKLVDYSDQLNQTIDFVAQVKGEPHQIEGPDGVLSEEWYVWVFLIRNQTKPISLKLSGIEKEQWPKDGEILRIKGVPIGYLFTSFNNNRTDLLEIEADSLTNIVAKNEAAATKNIAETDQYKIELISVDCVSNVADEPALVVYYNFKNKKEYMAGTPLRTYFFFSQKKEQLAVTILNQTNDQLNAKALHNDTLEAGAEMVYYEAFKLLDTSSPVHAVAYDDEYNVLMDTELVIASGK